MVNRSRSKSLSSAEAKAKVLEHLGKGKRVLDAMDMVDRSVKTYEYWCKQDGDFKRKVEQIRAVQARKNEDRRVENIDTADFASFREKYLGMRTFPHQQQWVDVLEGREPAELHRSVTYEPGRENFVLVNCPPEHSKSFTLSIDYPTYRVCMDPNVRIMIVSKTQEKAKEFLYAIKQRLTHPRFHELQLNFAPSDGFKSGSAVWQADKVYLSAELRDSAEKDPTVEALGIGGQIYGARADLIILDDCITLSNAHEYEKQIRWIQQEVLTRIGPKGKLVIAGTRVDSVDLYREIRDGDRYPDGVSPWTRLCQPAVLEFAESPHDWVTLWPRSDHPWAGGDDEPDGDGLYPRWDGPHLAHRRGVLAPKTWSMVYQQEEVPEDAVFDPQVVRACVNGNRTVGPLQPHNPYHRDEGMEGLYVVCGMDPAMSKDTATVAYGVDRKSGERFVLDAHKMTAPTPEQIRQMFFQWTDKYRPSVWVVEKNAFQIFLTRDEDIRGFLASRGVTMREHYTSGMNKPDPEFGVASLAPLFKEQLVELPSTHNSEGMKGLVEQLVQWAPGMSKFQKQDLPMALWFVEIVAREVVQQQRGQRRYANNRFAPRYRRDQQVVVNLAEMQQSRMDMAG